MQELLEIEAPGHNEETVGGDTVGMENLDG
jgi:hypothetical protein